VDKLARISAQDRRDLFSEAGAKLGMRPTLRRFSEDIDLVLDWKLIGYGQGLKGPMQTFPSTTQRDKFNKEINRIAAKFISEKLCPRSDDLVRQAKIGLTATVDEADPQVINIHYPAAFSKSTSVPRCASKSDRLLPGFPQLVTSLGRTHSTSFRRSSKTPTVLSSR
jgi:hypothetical protein